MPKARKGARVALPARHVKEPRPPVASEPRRILRTHQAAAYLGLAVPTLEKHRGDGQGPPFIRITSRMVGYDVADLDAFIAERRRTSTADPGPTNGVR